MAKSKKDDPKNYPALGRFLGRLDAIGKTNAMIWILAGICAFVLLLNWTYTPHGYFKNWDNVRGFYAIYGFLMFSGLIFVATLLRKLVKKPEDFYGSRAIDTETYPEVETDQRNHGHV